MLSFAQFTLFETDLSSVQALFAILDIYYELKIKGLHKNTHTRLHKKNPLLLFKIHFPFAFLSTFLFTLLFKQQQQLSGRDIICVPNALFISDRDFVQSFESRHGRHGNKILT